MLTRAKETAVLRCVRAQFGKSHLNIMAIRDHHGLPLAVKTHAANHDETTSVQLTFVFQVIVARSPDQIGDRAYDNNRSDSQIREQGSEMTALHRR
jgi:hypothetical protein